MNFSLNQFLLAVSSALDFVEIDILGSTRNHSKRVAYISLRLADHFGFTEDEKLDLCSFAILHDNGLSEEVLTSTVPDTPPANRLELLERYSLHCDIGEKNISDYPFLSGTANVVRYHHERYDGSGFFGIKGDAIPLMAQIIALADTVDNLFHFETPDFGSRQGIVEFIERGRGSFFSPALVDAFIKTSQPVSFWLDMREPYIHRALDELIPAHSVELSLEKVFATTRVFSRIIDAKSAFTFSHSSGLTDKAGQMADHYGFDQEHKWKLLVAASLHDLGKLAIPNAILDKPGKLDKVEFEKIMEHTYHTEKALQQIDGFEEITRWAARHHEKLDGSGYPHGLVAENLGFEDRLMACLDIYQALTENRPYRQGMSHGDAISILRQEGEKGRVDGKIVQTIDQAFSSSLAAPG
ncbi:MAG TPA: HD domain-containing phosphohydrolase [Sulfuricella sp.]|nr:HD domain-containing phosphohydrolase [Sulfuricella sp.]